MVKYAFVDRDGTLIKEFGRDEQNVAFPPKNTDEVIFLDGALVGLQRLRTHGYKFVLATNQSYLGTSRNPKDTYDTVMDYFYTQLKNHGIVFDCVMVCPHALEDNCVCKKPKVGGLTDFLRERIGQIDLENSLMFGDRETDRRFAKNLGVRYVGIETNKRFLLPPDL